MGVACVAVAALPALELPRSRSAGPVLRLRDDLGVFYWERGLPVRAQVSTAMPGVDDEFATHGFAIDTPVDVLVAPTAAVLAGNAPATDVVTSVSSVLDDTFAETYGRLHDDERVLAYGRMMQTIGPEARVVVARIDGEPVGMVFGVIERGWCGVYGLTTVGGTRGRGVASSVMHTRGRGQRNGRHAIPIYRWNATTLRPARSTTETGFTVAYGYHYRVKGAPATAG